MPPRPIRIKDFLENSNLEVAKVPPWVHSTSSNRIFDILEANKILATECSVFKRDKLCYCFVGRPAYKQKSVDSPSVWQLPMSFVVRFHREPKIKRVFPFDSGAFHHGRLPSYITCFKLDSYDIAGDSRNVGRLISLLYKDPKRYFNRKAAGLEELKEEYAWTIRHQEIEALGRLALDNSLVQCDDRAAAIEISLEQDIELNPRDIVGIVVPDEFKRDREVFDGLLAISPNIETYRHYPISMEYHYGLIYERVEDIYKRAGIRL